MWMSMRRTAVPDEVGRRFGLLLDKVLETGSVRRERDQEKEMIQAVHETDVPARELSRLLLAPGMEKEIGSIGLYHLLKLTLQVSKIADHAENAADRIRAMLARWRETRWTQPASFADADGLNQRHADRDMFAPR